MADVGRPSKYNPDFNFQVEKLAKLGATDKEIADFFNIQESTLNNWKIEHPEFMESIKRGKIIADSNVAQSLYHRAIGYQHKDTDIRVVDKGIVETPIVKYYPPDPTAAIFWLKNRRSKEWRDKQEVQQSTTIKDQRLDLSKLSDEELRILAEIQRKSGTSEA